MRNSLDFGWCRGVLGNFGKITQLCGPIKSDRSVVVQKLNQIPNPWSIAIKRRKMEPYSTIFRGSNGVISKKSHFPYKVIKRKRGQRGVFSSICSQGARTLKLRFCRAFCMPVWKKWGTDPKN